MGLNIFLGHHRLDTSALYINRSNRDNISHVAYVTLSGRIDALGWFQRCEWYGDSSGTVFMETRVGNRGACFWAPAAERVEIQCRTTKIDKLARP